MNYNELFNIAYSIEIPESLKEEVYSRIPLEESINEATSDFLPILEVLDTLAYSNIEEDRINSIIDDIFSNMDEALVEEIAEQFIKEKAIEYAEILEDIAHGTDAIGLAGIRKEREQRVKDKLADRAQAQARKQAIANTITKAREFKDKAVTGAREATEKAIAKGKEIKSNIQAKAGDIKNKAVDKIKGAVGKVKGWASKIGTDDTPIGLAQAIGKKAIENEKAGKENFKTSPYGSKAHKEEIKKEQAKTATTNSIKKTAEETPVAKEVKAKTPEVKATEAPKAEAKKEQPKAEQQKLKLDKPKPTETPKARGRKKKKEKPAETPKVEAKKEKEVKAPEAKPAKAKKVKQEQPQAKQTKTTKANKEKEVKVENKPAEAKKEEQPKASEVKVETPKAEQPQAKQENKSAEAQKEEQPKVKKKEMSNLERIGKQIEIEKKQRRDSEIKRLSDLVKSYDTQIASADGKPSMMAQIPEIRKKQDEARKKLQSLQAQVANEAFIDFAFLLAKTNISEEAFVEIMTMTNPIKDKKKKFKEIAKKKLDK